MKPAPFAYTRPRSVEEAIEALASDPDARPLAGGQSLVAMMNMRFSRPTLLVDVMRIPGLDTIHRTDTGLRVGATVRQRVAERDEKVRTHAPALALAISHVGHVQNRVRGSMGGSVAHLDPTAEIPAIALLLDGEVHLEGPSGARSVPMEAFMLAPFASAALPDELLTACTYREHGPRAVWSFHEIARRHGDVALAIAAGLRSPDQARIVMAGIGDVPRRLPVLERAILAGELKASDTREAARSALRGVDIVGSVIDGGDEHRRALAETALSRVLNDLALAA